MRKAAFDALAEMYRQLDLELGGLGLECRACGSCCHFDEYDHILYSTMLEVEFARSADPESCSPQNGRCPFQVDEKCTAGFYRPLGCRLFFCEAAGEVAEKLEEVSTRYHAKLQQIHRDYSIEWQYLPFLLRPDIK